MKQAMKNVFVDTNILIDLFADRRPFSKSAIEIFDLASKRKVNLYILPHYCDNSLFIEKVYPGKRIEGDYIFVVGLR